MKAKAAPRTATRAFAALSAFGLVCALVFFASHASAQETRAVKADAPAAAPAPPAPEAMAQQEEEIDDGPPQIGDATQSLMDWQSSGELASKTPRPIAGVVANRSYERYLKSFEFPIPERMSSTVKSSSGSGSSGSGVK